LGNPRLQHDGEIAATHRPSRQSGTPQPHMMLLLGQPLEHCTPPQLGASSTCTTAFGAQSLSS
jgi:hypothetical protein